MITQVDIVRRKPVSFCGVCGKRSKWYKPYFMHVILQCLWTCHIHQRDNEARARQRWSIFHDR